MTLSSTDVPFLTVQRQTLIQLFMLFLPDKEINNIFLFRQKRSRCGCSISPKYIENRAMNIV